MDSAMTLLEAAKLLPENMKTGIIGTYAEAYQVLTVCPVIQSGIYYNWQMEDSLAYSTGGTRSLNADFTASQGTVLTLPSQTRIYGGKIQVDRYIATGAPQAMDFQRVSQVKSFARRATIDIFQGAGAAAMNGVDYYIDNVEPFKGQTVNAATGGAVLTEAMLEDAVAKHQVVPGQTFIYMNDTINRRLMAVTRESGSIIRLTGDQFGYYTQTWRGIPIVVLQDGKNAALLSEVQNDGSGNLDTTSVYIVTWGTEMACLHSHNGTIAPNGVPVPYVEESNDGTNYKYMSFEWFVNFVPHERRCITRINHVNVALS